MGNNFDKIQKIKPDPNGNCSSCPFRRRVGSQYKGKVFISTIHSGKCIRVGGFCENYKIR